MASVRFAAFLQANNKFLLSSSPERFLKRVGDRLISQPIKGTAKRHQNQEDDLKAAKQLISNEKERAENKKNLDSKELALEKLRVERDELFTLVNTDKYRDFKTVEEEKIKFENKLNLLQQEMAELQKEYENEAANKA